MRERKKFIYEREKLIDRDKQIKCAEMFSGNSKKKKILNILNQVNTYIHTQHCAAEGHSNLITSVSDGSMTAKRKIRYFLTLTLRVNY